MKICKYCGKEFKPNKKCQIYCSPICRRRYRHYCSNRPLKTCQYCNREFRPKHNKDKYCSRECWRLSKIIPDKTNRIKWGGFCKLYIRECGVCNKTFITKYKIERYCSKECKKEFTRRCILNHSIHLHKSKTIKCVECNKEFVTEYGDKRQAYCSDRCRDNHKKKTYNYKLSRKIEAQKRRVKKHNNGLVERINPIEIFERDGWVCGICGKKINKKLKHPNIGSVTLDHIIPISKGGQHIKNNVQSAHLICNGKKSDRINNLQLKLCV